MTENWHTTNDERVDLAVCLLCPELVEYLGPEQKYFRISDFIPRKECGEGWYAIVGFPVDLIGPDAEGERCAKCWKYLTYPFRETHLVEKYDPNIHVVLKYERSASNGEKIIHPPAMSGCGIWYVSKKPLAAIGPDDLRLCAIQNAWHRKHEYAKGTWTDIVLEIIWTYYPEVRPAMRIHGCSF
jgi:hypothetical protein